MTKFQDFELAPTTLAALKDMGYEDPTPIQAASIPLLLEARDIIAQARTGTGKTAAFGIPLVDGAAGYGAEGPLALVLVPTRELALQVADELARIAQGTRVRVIPVYGGVGMGAQVHGLSSRCPFIVVATPGRLLDHMQRGFRLGTVRALVLDEADRMLDMGFLPDVERILKALPRDRQTALFSATLPDQIKQLCKRFLENPAMVRTEDGPLATPQAEQFRVDVHGGHKPEALRRLLEKEAPERAIVFTRTKHLAKRLAKVLSGSGWHAEALQGNMSQSQRERALDSFRDGRARVLVATDIASRGLDVPEVSHVVNYDVPREPESYVHRVGRTARMGRSGRAFTLVAPDQARDMRDVERFAGVPIAAYDLGLVAPTHEAPPNPGPPRHRGPSGRQGRPQGRGRHPVHHAR